MCVPMAAAALVATIASTAMTAYGMYQQAGAQKSAMQAESAAADRERISADERADLRAQRLGAEVADARGRQMGVLGASGVDANYGSAAGLQATTDYYGLQDQQIAAKNAADVDFNYRERSRQLRSGASQIRPWMSAGGSLLSGAGKVAQSWYNWKG